MCLTTTNIETKIKHSRKHHKTLAEHIPMEWLKTELAKMEHNKMFIAKTFQQYRATPIQLLTGILSTTYNFFRKALTQQEQPECSSTTVCIPRS